MPGLFFSENGIQNGRNGSKRTPDNSIWLSSDNLSTTSSVHEIAAHHLYSRYEGSHLLDWSENPDPNIPSIRATIQTTNVPTSLCAPYKNGEITLNIALRQVLAADKEKMQITWTGKPRMGGGTNTIFTEDGNQIIYNQSKIKETYDKDGKKIPNND